MELITLLLIYIYRDDLKKWILDIIHEAKK